IQGIAEAEKFKAKRFVTTISEHPSQGGALTCLAQKGADVLLAESEKSGGRVCLEALEKQCAGVLLGAFSLVESETGVVQNAKEIGGILHANGALFHLDATQAAGKIPIADMNADTISFSPHKYYGLNGIAFLAKKKDLVIAPLIKGGGNLTPLRSGTISLPLLLANEEATRIAANERSTRFKMVDALNALLRARLSEIESINVNSPVDALPHILNLSFKNADGKEARQYLYAHGICVSHKSACSAPDLPSKAVFNLTQSKKLAQNSFRVSLSHLTTETDLSALIEVIKQI
ncbi:MAG: aminotransferase class V-fold PLP-dependent enzyme, partial [Christensenellaceae bacterium]|nr:aminotransferase class V-fold PLP-dependent enzyme [Christensenellaceae bacterium]